MPHISQLSSSKYLKQEDCGPKGILVTIKGIHKANVAKDDSPPEEKWCLDFREDVKPMILNQTNAEIIAGIIGSEDTDDWVGHKVVLFADASVKFGQKKVGGIRARAPRNPAPQQSQSPPPARRPAPPPQPVDEWPDDQRGDAYEGADQGGDY
jgi:hypothetical protein